MSTDCAELTALIRPEPLLAWIVSDSLCPKLVNWSSSARIAFLWRTRLRRETSCFTWWRAGRVAPRDFPWAKPEGNPKEQPCQPKENPVFPDYFTQIYILFIIGLRIGPPKMHRLFCSGVSKIHSKFRIGPPKIHRRLRIGPPQVTLKLLLPEFHSRWILVYHGYYARKATKLPIWNRIGIHEHIKWKCPTSKSSLVNMFSVYLYFDRVLN